jgi:hypothetical protein
MFSGATNALKDLAAHSAVTNNSSAANLVAPCFELRFHKHDKISMACGRAHGQNGRVEGEAT